MRNELLLNLVTDLAGTRESYRVFTAPLNWLLESGDRVEFNVVPEGERIRADFPIAEGVVIPPGAYNWTRYRVEVDAASKRPVNGRLSYWGATSTGEV